jgi:AraC-like DNA-binding protein
MMIQTQQASQHDVRAFALTQSTGVEALIDEAARAVLRVAPLSWNPAAAQRGLCAPWHVLVIDLSPARLDFAAAVARTARTMRPQGAIIGLSSFSRDGASLASSSAARAFTDIVFLDAEDPIGFLRAHFLDKSGTGARGTALRAAYMALPESFHRLAKGVLLARNRRMTVEELAARVASRRGGVQEDTTTSLGVSGGDFVDWCRAIHAAALFEHASWTVEHVSHEVGFNDLESFRKTIKRLLGKLPHELHGDGATSLAGRRFADAISHPASSPSRRQFRRYRTPRTPA